MSSITPTDLKPLLENFLNLGELTQAEVLSSKSISPVDVLGSNELITDINLLWIVNEKFINLLPFDDIDELLREVCIMHPDYYNYLIVLIVGEITRRSLEGAIELTEEWVVKEFVGIASELNQVLNEFEREEWGVPVRQTTPGMVVTSCNKKMETIQSEAGIDFNEWNKDLFGVSGNNEAVFQVLISKNIFKNAQSMNGDKNQILSEIVDLNNDLANPNGRMVFFPPLDEDHFENLDLNLLSSPAWRKRQYVYSSIPLWDKNEDKPITTKDVQNALCQHPVPWILIQLGIAQNTQKTFYKGKCGLFMQVEREENNQISDLFVSIDDQPTRKFSEILPDWLNSLGFRLVLPFGEVPKRRVGTLIAILIEVGIFNLEVDGILTLSKDFVSRLYEKKWLKEMVKVPKPFRKHFIQVLDKIS